MQNQISSGDRRQTRRRIPMMATDAGTFPFFLGPHATASSGPPAVIRVYAENVHARLGWGTNRDQVCSEPEAQTNVGWITNKPSICASARYSTQRGAAREPEPSLHDHLLAASLMWRATKTTTWDNTTANWRNDHPHSQTPLHVETLTCGTRTQSRQSRHRKASSSQMLR